MRKLAITVIGDSFIEGRTYDFCEKMGQLLGKLNAVIITGGKGGVMEAVLKGVKSVDGNTIGILPSDNKDDANPYCDIVIPTGLGHARNTLTIMASDIVIVIGGGAGTLTEMGFSWIYNKPIITFRQFGGWADKLSGTAIDHRRNERIRSVNDLKELLKVIKELANDMGFKVR